jgi:signal transduction histidine kinase
MTQQAKRYNPAGLQHGKADGWSSDLPVMERPILLLRGLALLLVIILHLFDRSSAGVLFPVPQMVLVLVAYSGLLFLLLHYVRWLRRPLNYLALDTVLATLAVYLTGGYHSSFFVLYVFITIGAAFQLELTRTVIVTLAIGLIYVGACYVNPAGLQSPYAQYILSAKLLLLLIVAVLCGLLLEQLRQEQHETEREREQVARLRALDELRRGFVSAVSHELRTPLTCVKTSVELLSATSDGFSAEQVELVRTIEHHVGRLEALLTDLLEIIKLEAGQITLSKQPTDLRLLVSRAVETVRPLSDRKDQSVHLDWPEIVSQVEVDRRRIEQVLNNILSNAVKFTPRQGRIEVRMTETAHSLRVCVADSGPGIPDKDQAHIFDKFYVVADGRGLSGLGLGLFVAREMIELHEGHIWVESRLGEGSNFCFEVPKGDAADRPSPRGEP